MSYHPYLYFDGTCREAMTFYHEVFGGDLVIMDGSEAPPDTIPEGKADLVMHAAIVNGDELLMASDSYDDDFAPAVGTWVHYSTTDIDRAKAVFDGLSEGADIRSPGHEEFWTPYYASLVDRFGTPWQISVEQEQPEG